MLLGKNGELMVEIGDEIEPRTGPSEEVKQIRVTAGIVHCVEINNKSYTSTGEWMHGRQSDEDIMNVIKKGEWKEYYQKVLRDFFSAKGVISALKTTLGERNETISSLEKDVARLSELTPKEGSFEWAISQMRQGKKVRHVKWEPSEFIVLVGQTIQDEFEYTYELCGIDINEQWQLYEEPKKELAVGQKWADEAGNTREIIAIREGVVSYFYNGRNEPDCQRETFFLESSANKLLGDAE